MAEQLTLKGISLRTNTTFNDFLIAQNQQVVSQLQAFSQKTDERFIYLWGNGGSGKSHLLQACCHQAADNNLQAFYLPLMETKTMTPALLDDLEQLDIICIDDIDTIAGDAKWEEALFNLYNRLQAANTYLLIAATTIPQELSLTLADLTSRLTAGVIFHLASLNDEEKIQALQMNALVRGFSLSDDVAYFLLRRCPRNMADLFNLLDKLDKASLIAKRKLTVPFVKSVLEL